MRVTSKGQVTIPQGIREQSGIQPGSEVEFKLDGNDVRIVKTADGQRGSQLIERLRGSGHGRLSTDEILAHTRE